MTALYSHTTRATGTTLTAAIYNADHQNHITNGIPAQLDDYSSSVAEMQTTADPGEVGSESQATSLAGEIERLRFAILELKQRVDPAIAQWYETPYPGDTSGRPPLPAWYIDGLEMSVAVSSTKYVQVATGWCRSADDRVNLKVSTPLSRGLTALWASAVASGGGLCGVAIANKSVFHVFVFKTAVSTYDIGADTVLTASNLMGRASLVATDQHYRRIGSNMTVTASGTANAVTQRGREVIYLNMDYEGVQGDHVVYNPTNSLAATLAFVKLISATNIMMVPTGFGVRAKVLVYATAGGPTGRVAVFDGVKSNIPNAPAEMMAGYAGNGVSMTPLQYEAWTSNDGELLVYYQATAAAVFWNMAVLGWTDLCRA